MGGEDEKRPEVANAVQSMSTRSGFYQSDFPDGSCTQRLDHRYGQPSDYNPPPRLRVAWPDYLTQRRGGAERRGALIMIPATASLQPRRVDKRSAVHQRRHRVRWTSLALVHPTSEVTIKAEEGESRRVRYADQRPRAGLGGRNDDQGPISPVTPLLAPRPRTPQAHRLLAALPGLD